MRIAAPPLGGAATSPGGQLAPKHSSLRARARAGEGGGVRGGGRGMWEHSQDNRPDCAHHQLGPSRAAGDEAP